MKPSGPLRRHTPLKARSRLGRVGKNSKRRRYSDYLRSRQWRELRQKVLARDDFTCRTCGRPADQAGHLTYERFGEELLSDLIAQCWECNQAERGTRILA